MGIIHGPRRAFQTPQCVGYLQIRETPRIYLDSTWVTFSYLG